MERELGDLPSLDRPLAWVRRDAQEFEAVVCEA